MNSHKKLGAAGSPCVKYNTKYLKGKVIYFCHQGIVDVGKEICKLENKKEKLVNQLQKLNEATQISDYETKVQSVFCAVICFFVCTSESDFRSCGVT